MSDSKYYTAGWKRFELNRRKILANYDLAKFENRDRPLQTEHGVIAESTLRKWLSSFLPERYGITSGFIIPPILEDNNYKSYHYDIIIYDKLDSPVIWEGDDSDKNKFGQNKAIPAQKVLAVFEVKASLTDKSSKDVLIKLNELNDIRRFLPKNFFRGVIFIELESGSSKKLKRVKNLISDNRTIVDLGCILRYNNDLNSEVSGLIDKFTGINKTYKDSTCVYRDINCRESSFGIFDITNSSEVINEEQHFYKRYIFNTRKNDSDFHGISIEWSRNSFSFFALSLLSRFKHGVNFRKNSTGGFPFGLVFDKVKG